MIDFVKIYYRNKDLIEPFILSEENFPNLKAETGYHTGELNYPYKDKIENMNLIVNEKSLAISNSLHKLKNYREFGEDHNHNDFTYSELIKTIDFLESKTVDIESSKLTRFEFGLNIEVDKPAEDIINDSVFMHSLKLHSLDNNFNGRGRLKMFNHNEYDIKIYDKAKQYGLPKNVLRFEVKYKKSNAFNKKGIYKLSDLKQKAALMLLFKDLIKRFDEMIIIDDRILDFSTQKKLTIYTSFNYWEQFKHRENRNKKAKELKKFNQFLEDNSLLQTKKELRLKLIQKFRFLMTN